MRLPWPLVPVLFLLPTVALAQLPPAETRTVAHFEVHNTPRLLAIARLGALTRISILVEADTLPYLQAPVSLIADNATAFTLASEILRGSEPYRVREQGKLLIFFPTRNRSRLLTLPLGPFRLDNGSLTALLFRLGDQLRLVSGCKPQTYASAGPSSDLAIPPMDLPSATLEQIITLVAEAPMPSMWVIEPQPTISGCIPDPLAHWQVGFYGFGSRFTNCDIPFRESIGPNLVPSPVATQMPDTSCTQPHLPNPPPALPPPT